MAKTYENLKADANIIKNEVEAGKNTATRVGTMFGDVIDTMNGSDSELLARLQGTSTNSNPQTYPFKRMGSYTNINEILAELDNMHGSSQDNSSMFIGNWRAYMGARFFDIHITVEDYSSDTWSQEIKMPFRIHLKEIQNPDAGNEYREDKVFTNDNGDILGGYYHSTYTPTFEASGGRLKDEHGYMLEEGLYTYRRRCVNGEWGDWYDANNPYFYTPLYGKKIAFFGGSYAQNTYSKDGFGFNYKGKAYSFNNYIAQMLGAKRVDNYAIGGNGHSADFTYNTKAQVLFASKDSNGDYGFTYDVYVIMGGINDYISNKPIADMLSNLKSAVDFIRELNPRAIVYFTTPFKSYWTASDWGWNINTSKTNELGNTFAQYTQALRDLACDLGLPLLDIFAMQGFGSANRNNCYYEYKEGENNDLVHPNGLGYKLISNAFLNFIAYGIGHNTIKYIQWS